MARIPIIFTIILSLLSVFVISAPAVFERSTPVASVFSKDGKHKFARSVCVDSLDDCYDCSTGSYTTCPEGYGYNSSGSGSSGSTGSVCVDSDNYCYYCDTGSSTTCPEGYGYNSSDSSDSSDDSSSSYHAPSSKTTKNIGKIVGPVVTVIVVVFGAIFGFCCAKKRKAAQAAAAQAPPVMEQNPAVGGTGQQYGTPVDYGYGQYTGGDKGMADASVVEVVGGPGHDAPKSPPPVGTPWSTGPTPYPGT